MANVAIDTGHGATVTFGTSSFAFNWLTIDPGERVREPVETTHLGSSVPTYMPGDLQYHDSATITFEWDPKTTAAPATTTTAETVTITWPIVTSAGATLAGTALVKRIKFPPLQTQTLQVGEMELQWTGATAPTYTAGT